MTALAYKTMENFSVFDYTIAVLLASFGVATIAVILWLVFGAVAPLFFGFAENYRIKAMIKSLEGIDALIASSNWNEVLKELPKAMIFIASSSKRYILVVRDHNQNLLSRCLIVSEEIATRADNIAAVEALFMERSELQVLHLKAKEAFARIQDRREQMGKDVPQWTRDDYQKKVRDIERELEKNLTQLKGELDKFFGALKSIPREGVTYH